MTSGWGADAVCVCSLPLEYRKRLMQVSTHIVSDRTNLTVSTIVNVKVSMGDCGRRVSQLQRVDGPLEVTHNGSKSGYDVESKP
jgi:hypothetical protein